MKRILQLVLLALAAAAAYWLWSSGSDRGGEEHQQAAGGREADLGRPLQLNEEASAGAAESRPPAVPAGEDVQSTPGAAPSSAETAEGVRALDSWHRALPEKRGEMRWNDRINAALAGFGTIWSGGGAAYAAAVRLDVPQALGQDFADYARAYAGGGVPGLEQRLRSAKSPSPAWRAWQEALAVRGFETQADAPACVALGAALRGMMEEGYPRERILGLRGLVEQARGRGPAFLPFEEYAVQPGDSYDRICREYRKKGVLLNYKWIAEFNQRSNYRVRADTVLRIPRVPLQIEAGRGQRLLLVYAGDVPIRLYEASFGKPGDETPLGSFTIETMLENPVYWPPDGSPSLPFGHPDNPLGSRWIGFLENSQYGIHGTTQDGTVGTYESLGCIRLRGAEVEDLFELVPRGAKVIIRP